MSMLRCPVCGSTAQVRLTEKDCLNLCSKRVNKYTCGCGCCFEAVFELQKINVITEKTKNNT